MVLLLLLNTLIAMGGDVPASGTVAPECGFALTAEDADAGWIGLFDGQTTFGWSGAQLLSGILSEGKTTSRFGRCRLKAQVVKDGTINAGGKRYAVKTGDVQLTIPDRLDFIALEGGLSVRSLSIQPLDLESILNDKTVAGWEVVPCGARDPENQPEWNVTSGSIQVTGGQGALEYKELYSDFMLQVDVLTRVPHANGGLFFRNIPGVCLMGYEAQILNLSEENEPSRPSGYTSGAIDDRMPARRLVSRDRIYFKMTVLADGPHLATWVNGYQLVDWTDERPVNRNPREGLCTIPGTFQLQAHDPDTSIEFKNIRVKKLK